MKTRSGADCVVEGLQRVGVKTLFGLPGGAVLDIFSKLYHAEIEFILTRHEQGATHMADGYARATGRTGCCIVTSGPGATNTITGLATANMDGVPLVCITGQVPSSLIGNDAFQEADTIGITRPVTKHNYLVRSVHDLPRTIAEAFHVASSGKPGPVVIDIPKDVQQASTDVPYPRRVSLRGYSPSEEGDPAQIAKLAAAINRATRPLLYVGGGVISGNAAGELTRLARKTGIPVTTTLMGLGAFPETDPLALRMLGMHGSVAANKAVSHCDLLVAVGARFDDRVTGKVSEFAPHALKTHLDIDPEAIGRSLPIDIAIVGHVKKVLRQLLPMVRATKRTAWLKQIAQWQREHQFRYDQASTELLPQYVVEKIYEVTEGDAIVVTDVGQHQMWAAQFFKYTKPRTFLSSGGLGTMGYGLPAAIGAQAGKRDSRVILIAGDGSIQMNFQELVVAVEHELPVKVVIINNGYLGMVRQWQQMFYNREYSASCLGRTGRAPMEKINCREPGYLPDFVKLAEAHGAIGLRVCRKKELVPALSTALKTPGPVVVECMVKPDENVYPMVPPGASLTEMVLV
ncbi:MAG: biosynthetic-type acetolactate synthase large subunit [Kiritimatiellae bacterium]|nr:biosynthetic-type acetolactate synthase large subunit [Kiritimatiellia bacterium]